MSNAGIFEWEVSFLISHIGVVGELDVFPEQVQGHLWNEDIELEFFSFLPLHFLFLLLVEVDDGDSEESVILGVGAVGAGSVHVEFDCYVADFDFDVHDDLLEELLEEVDGAVLADFPFQLVLLHVELVEVVQFDHFLLEVFGELLVGLESHLDVRNVDFDALGRNLRERGEGDFEEADDPVVEDVGTADEVFPVDFVDVDFDVVEVEGSVFEIIEGEFLGEEAVESAVEGVLDEGADGVEVGDFVDDGVVQVLEHLLYNIYIRSPVEYKHITIILFKITHPLIVTLHKSMEAFGSECISQ